MISLDQLWFNPGEPTLTKQKETILFVFQRKDHNQPKKMYLSLKTTIIPSLAIWFIEQGHAVKLNKTKVLHYWYNISPE